MHRLNFVSFVFSLRSSDVSDPYDECNDIIDVHVFYCPCLHFNVVTCTPQTLQVVFVNVGQLSEIVDRIATPSCSGRNLRPRLSSIRNRTRQTLFYTLPDHGYYK
jgi:hypothetical protein